jgi:iturin family lipopeptide synthetase B
MLGIWKAGAAYFYHDLRLPLLQFEEIVEQCHCPLIIDEAFLQELEYESSVPELDFSAPESLALLIFTSGSTGKPKGVMIEHRNITAMLLSTAEFGLTAADAVCMFPSFSFIAAISDTYSTLLAGGTLFIIEESLRRDIELIINYFSRHGITVSFLPPHMADKLNEREQGRTKLRLLLVGSDNMHNLTPQRYAIRHVYGASEACSLIADYPLQDARQTYPVGYVKPVFRYYIVDSDGERVLPSQAGELWLSGPQVSRGYLNDQPRTMRYYSLNPFSNEPGYERVFKTSDIVQELPDGTLRYISRKDNMFKIRGFRVEAGAVENALLQYPRLIDAVVKAFPDAKGNNILCGWFRAGTTLDPKAVKNFLQERVPYYMVPACLIQMEEFPLTENNKVNRAEFLPPAEINDHKLLAKLW